MACTDATRYSEPGCPESQMFYLEYLPSSTPNLCIKTVKGEHSNAKNAEFLKFFAEYHNIEMKERKKKETPKKEIQENQETKKKLKFVCPKTFHLSTYQFSYLLSQLDYNTRTQNTTGLEVSYFLKIVVRQPLQHSIDYKSNDIANMSMVEKRELEHSMNWLSTLGGAFSALGENSVPFAQRAGRVSKGQFLIAIKLGSPQTMSRCRLYAAISLLQLGKFKFAREILRREYAYAMSLPDDSDPRLRRMCIGIWSKLQYEWKLNRAKLKSQENKRAVNGAVKTEI